MSFPAEPLGLRLLGIIAPALFAISALFRWHVVKSLSFREMAVFVALSVAYAYIIESGCGTPLIACLPLLVWAAFAALLPTLGRDKKRLADRSPHTANSRTKSACGGRSGADTGEHFADPSHARPPEGSASPRRYGGSPVLDRHLTKRTDVHKVSQDGWSHDRLLT